VNLPRVLLSLLAVNDRGVLAPPGSGLAWRRRQGDGCELAVVTRGDGVDLYVGREDITVVALEPREAARLGRFLARWWARSCWWGIRLWLWEKALSWLVAGQEGAS
jgi:hypothetical protein